MTAVLLLSMSVTVQSQSLADMIQQARDAGIEQAQLERLQDRAAARGISDSELMQIIEPAVSLAEQNLPSDMIFQKAMEGIAKGIPAGRMQPVLQNLQQSTVTSVGIVDPWVERADIAQMVRQSGENITQESFRYEMLKFSSKAISQSIEPGALQDLLNEIGREEILSQTRPSGILAAVSVMPDLPSAAENPGATSQVIVRAMQSGFNASDLQKLPGAMNMAQRRSQLPAAAVIEGVSQQLQGGIPAAQILQNLFNGNVGGGPPGNIPPGLDNRPDRGQGQGDGTGF